MTRQPCGKGGVTYWDWSLVPVKNLTGAIAGLVLTVIDITERQREKEELRKHRENLKELVEEQTSEIRRKNKQLKLEIRERKQAEKARIVTERRLEEQRTLVMRTDRLRSLGEMAAGIAHELNQPLVGVRGLAEQILIGMKRGWEITDEELQEDLTLIIQQVDRMSHIIEHVRIFAREAGKPELSSVQVNDVVESAMDLLGAQLKSRGIELECELAEDLPPVMANPFSLEEVILNLIINARDAVEERQNNGSDLAQERILLRTFWESENEKRYVKIKVIDWGVGIPEDTISKVFDPFFTTKSPQNGTGLGLSISKSLVEQFGGTIQIESEPGQGTTAIISLPDSRDFQTA
jgi:C4-dicarboxylate-specific signal transduction histidine kinase